MITTPTDLLEQLLADLATAVGGAENLGPLEAIAEEYVAMLDRIFEAAIAQDVPLAQAEGALAEALAGITGVFLLAGAAGRVTVTLTGEPGTPIAAGAQVATVEPVPTPGDFGAEAGSPASIGADVVAELLSTATKAVVFALRGSAVLETARVVGSADTVDVGEIFSVDHTVSVFASEWIFVCTAAVDPQAGFGNMDGSALFSIPGDKVQSEGGYTIKTIGRGKAYAQVEARSIEPLAEAVPAGALATLGSVNADDDIDAVLTGVVAIETPVPGWLGVLNLDASDPGRLQETAARLRSRLERSAAHDRGNSYNGGQGIEATLLRLTGVAAARVVIDEVAHTASVQVVGGSAAAIARAIHGVIHHSLTLTAAAPVTIETEEVIRADGRPRTIVFQRPEAVPVDVVATIVVEAATYAGDEAVAAHLATLAITDQTRPVSERLQPGEDVYASRLSCEILDVAGVQSVDLVRVDGGGVVAIEDYQYATIGTVTLTVQGASA